MTHSTNPVAIVRDQLAKMEGEFRSALPKHIPVERFSRVAMTAINRNPDLLSADRKTLFEAAMLAAQDGLFPDGREAAFVIYNVKTGSGWKKAVQYLPMVAGLRKKIYQSGEITSLVARAVFSDDQFEVVFGDDERITHTPNLDSQGEIIAVYAIATHKDGSRSRDVMSITEINRIRGLSRSGDRGPWKDHYVEMAKKTVIKRLAKSLPLSSEVYDVMNRDDYLYAKPDETSSRIESPRTISTALEHFAAPDNDYDDCNQASANVDDSLAGGAESPDPDGDSAPEEAAIDLASDVSPLQQAYRAGYAMAESGVAYAVPRGWHYKSKDAERNEHQRGYEEYLDTIAAKAMMP